MSMFKNVLVGVDGSSGGRDALALALRLLNAAGQLTLIHVHLETTGIVVHEFDSSARDDAQRLLESEREAAGRKAELLSIGAPSVGGGLHRVAEQNAADLLAVGTCRHGFVGRVLLGDDTRASLAGAPCAVAIAPLGYAQTSAPIEVIGVGYDASPESDAALALARVLAADSDVKVRALSVVSALPYAYAGLAPMNSARRSTRSWAKRAIVWTHSTAWKAGQPTGCPVRSSRRSVKRSICCSSGHAATGPGGTSCWAAPPGISLAPHAARSWSSNVPDPGQVRPRAQATLEQ